LPPRDENNRRTGSFLKIRPVRLLKAVFYAADNKFVFVVIRGDLPVNEIKLKNTLALSGIASRHRWPKSRETELSPARFSRRIENIMVVADDSITFGTNFVAGAQTG